MLVGIGNTEASEMLLRLAHFSMSLEETGEIELNEAPCPSFTVMGSSNKDH